MLLPNSKKPKVVVYDSKGKVISSQYYTVTYKDNKKIGTGTIVVKFKGSYSGTFKKTFKIVPKNTSLVKVSGISKGIKVNWKKKTAQTSGYQIQYSTSKEFASKLTKQVTVKDNTVKSLSIKKLKAKKTYYVRIRTYKNVGGKKYYSSWSNAKKVTTKK